MSHYSGSVPATPRRVDWRDNAACRNEEPDDWFPVGSTPAAQAQTVHAKAVCWTCPALEACGRWALQTRQPFGIWGGMTESERRAVLRRRGVRVKGVDPDDVEAAA